MNRCEATNEAGASCLFLEHSPQVRHMWGNSKERNHFDLGKLQATVRAYLAGDVDRDRLATILAETEEGR